MPAPPSLPPETRLSVLERLYALHAEFTRSFDTACVRGCGECCTRNVTLTSLEAAYIFRSLTNGERERLTDRVRAEAGQKRLLPRSTINSMAAMCLAGDDPPEDESDPAWGPCPLLTDDECPIYAVRPLACRCMVSRQPCSETGFADMPDLMISLNNVFMQYVEQIDAGGLFGNLTDMLIQMEDAGGNLIHAPKPTENLIPNHPVPALMIPPEHREKLRPVLEAAAKIRP